MPHAIPVTVGHAPQFIENSRALYLLTKFPCCPKSLPLAGFWLFLDGLPVANRQFVTISGFQFADSWLKTIRWRVQADPLSILSPAVRT